MFRLDRRGLRLREQLALASAYWIDPAVLNEAGLGDLLGSAVRAVRTDGVDIEIDCRLRLGAVTQRAAKQFIARHHRHCPPPCGWRYGIAAYNASRLVGVVWVGRPVARLLDFTRIVEVNRLCTLDTPLAKQAASMLLAAAAREAKRRGFCSTITYTLAEESGVSLRAAGWREDGQSRGGTRSRQGRTRSEHAKGPKTRWIRELRASAHAGRRESADHKGEGLT